MSSAGGAPSCHLSLLSAGGRSAGAGLGRPRWMLMVAAHPCSLSLCQLSSDTPLGPSALPGRGEGRAGFRGVVGIEALHSYPGLKS